MVRRDERGQGRTSSMEPSLLMSENTWMLLLLSRYVCRLCTVVLTLLLSVSLARLSCDANLCAFPAPTLLSFLHLCYSRDREKVPKTPNISSTLTLYMMEA